MNTKFSCVTIALALMTMFCFTTISATKLTDTQAQGLFVEFARRYDKSYELSDFFHRFQVFRDNVQWIMDFNDDKSNTHQVGVNFFADMTPDEWIYYTGLKVPTNYKEPDYSALEKREDKDDPELVEMRLQRSGLKATPPDEFDWNKEGVLLPVRNQLSCGSCYSFSSMAAVEGLRAITFPQETKQYLSVQQGIDCTRKYGCYGCQGGWMSYVFNYLIDIGGACTDEEYPYKNRVTSCQDQKCDKVFQFNKYRDVSGVKPETIIEHVNVNPLSIAVTSNTREFMYYKSGVITNCGGSRDQQIDHAVTLVGYNQKESTDPQTGRAFPPYILIRNSWGESWGVDKGHVKVALDGNVCKYRSNISYPVIHAPHQPSSPAI